MRSVHCVNRVVAERVHHDAEEREQPYDRDDHQQHINDAVCEDLGRFHAHVTIALHLVAASDETDAVEQGNDADRRIECAEYRIDRGQEVAVMHGCLRNVICPEACSPEEKCRKDQHQGTAESLVQESNADKQNNNTDQLADKCKRRINEAVRQILVLVVPHRSDDVILQKSSACKEDCGNDQQNNLFAEHRSTLAVIWQVDPVNKVVRHRQLEEEHHFAYFEGLFDSTEEKVFDKVGTSDNPLRRWWENLHTAGYAKAFDLTTDEIYRCWDCQSIPSEGLESYLRAMLIAKYRGKNYYPNDRFYFKDGEFTPPTMEEIDKWADTYQRMCGLL